MSTSSKPWGELLVCAFIAAVSLFLFAHNAWPISKPLLQAEGRIISRTPIYSKGNLTGFRFCIDKPRLTFTYANPDPRVKSIWTGINNASRARVIYSSYAHANPRLWGLSLDGYEMARPDEVRSARLKGALTWLAASLLAIAYGLYAWRRSKKVPPNNSFKPTPLRGAA